MRKFSLAASRALSALLVFLSSGGADLFLTVRSFFSPESSALNQAKSASRSVRPASPPHSPYSAAVLFLSASFTIPLVMQLNMRLFFDGT